MTKDQDIPRDHKLLALSLLTMAQLMACLDNPAITEEHKAEVRDEIKRRECKL